MISKFMIICIFHLCNMAGSWCKSEIKFNCDNLKGLCPGETYRQRCRPISEAKLLHLQITLTGGNCTYNVNKKYEFDYSYNPNEHIKNETQIDNLETDKKCGNISGTLTTHNNPAMKSIYISFQATKYIDQANLSCMALLNDSSDRERECIVTIADMPSPPTNISFSECTPQLISWEPPSVLQGKADENLKYIVTLTSLGNSKTITTAYTYYKLRTIDTMTSYNICVAAVNCVGESTSVCKEKIIESSNLPALSLNVSSIVNSSAVELSWKSANVSQDDNGICYDIEQNYNIEHRCISGNNATIRITCKKEELFHSFRVRANMHERTHGEWSNSVCITFAPPSPLLFVNHTVINSRSAKSNIGTLRLSIELQDQSAGIAGTCHNVKVRGVEIMIKRKDSEDHSHTIPENEMKYEVNFTLVQGNEENFMISAKPKSIVGDGPEQIHRFVHTTGGGYIVTYSITTIVIMLIISSMIQHMTS